MMYRNQSLTLKCLSVLLILSHLWLVGYTTYPAPAHMPWQSAMLQPVLRPLMKLLERMPDNGQQLRDNLLLNPDEFLRSALRNIHSSATDTASLLAIMQEAADNLYRNSELKVSLLQTLQGLKRDDAEQTNRYLPAWQLPAIPSQMIHSFQTMLRGQGLDLDLLIADFQRVYLPPTGSEHLGVDFLKGNINQRLPYYMELVSASLAFATQNNAAEVNGKMVITEIILLVVTCLLVMVILFLAMEMGEGECLANVLVWVMLPLDLAVLMATLFYNGAVPQRNDSTGNWPHSIAKAFGIIDSGQLFLNLAGVVDTFNAGECWQMILFFKGE